MLSPDYLAHISDDIIKLYQQLEDDIISDIVRRLVGTDFEMTQSAVWQMEKLQQMGLVYEDALKRIGAATGKTEKELKKLFEDAGMETLRFDDSIYKKAGLNPLPLLQSPSMLNVLTAGLQKTGGTLKNLTLTTANTSQALFISSADSAYMQVASGAFDYNTAVRNAVKQASAQGLEVLYPTGHRDKIDVAVRRAVLTGVSQTCGKLQEMRMEELGCTLVEVTAHMGARQDHQFWQGKVYRWNK